ncbi:glycosyltransferase family protein [Peribacillus sp. SCS-37]|uniref:glycosyltransferase family protein n=1 Tax=Paraperibacillus esterisolvens TaxID=3115296 RepID=UPI0039061670
MSNKPIESINRAKVLNEINKLPQYRFSKWNRPDIRVACILDTFSYECFKYECTLEQLHRFTWKDQIDQFKPHFLFVESAWKGEKDSWQTQLTNLELKPRAAIRDVIGYCKKNNIKTVFWCKEDPSNFDHFIETAKLFDYIFTTDAQCIEKYKKAGSTDNVFVLPFAAQPMIHNPVHSTSWNKKNIAFAGSWHSQKYPERSKQMEMLFKAAKEMGLDIFDRHFEQSLKSIKYPDKYSPYIVGGLDYPDMVKAYKLYKVFLNVNSITDSPTMFSRRVFELLACGTNVVSTYSKGIADLFSGIVPICQTEEEVEQQLQMLLKHDQYRERLSLLGIRSVFSNHLYRHRFSEILRKIGLSGINEEPMRGVSIITCTNRSHSMDLVFQNYENQVWPNKELIIILNKDDMNLKEWRNKAKMYENVSVFRQSEHYNLGKCLNFAVDNARYPFVSKFDDDDYYAPNFLTDLMHAFEYTDADIVGKGTYYSYLEGMKVLALRSPKPENQFVNFISGATMIVKKSIFNSVRFSEDVKRGSDTIFLKDCISKNYKIYSSDKYNYVCLRSSNVEEHTWKIKDMDFLRKCSIVAYTEDYKTQVTI